MEDSQPQVPLSPTPPPVVPPTPNPVPSHKGLYIGLTVVVVLLLGVGVTAFAFPVLKTKILSFAQVALPNHQTQVTPVTFAWVPLAQATSSAYFANSSGVVFYGNDAFFMPVASSTAASFEVLTYTSTSTNYTTYAEDASYVYDNGQVIEGADPATFEVLPYTNAVGDYQYAKDVHAAYFDGTAITGADVSSFAALYDVSSNGYDAYSSYYAKDDRYVYQGGSLISSLDPKTVSLVGDYVRDATSVYGVNTTIDPSTFIYLGGRFYKDKNNYYCDAQTILHIKDPTTFAAIEDGYAKDSQAVYSAQNCGALANSDPSTFEVLDDTYAKDSHNVYIDGTQAQGIDPATFSPINDTYFIDGDQVYYTASSIPSVIEGADTTTFHPVGPSDSGYAIDGQHVYYQGAMISGAAPSSFTILSDYYAKDARQVYYLGSVILGADSATFTASSTDSAAAQDAHGSYSYGQKISSGADPVLLAGVQKLRLEGYPDDQIRSFATNGGWTTTQIDEVFASLPINTNTSLNSTLITTLATYISTTRGEGYTDSVIRAELITNGDTADQVDAAFAAASSSTPVSPVATYSYEDAVQYIKQYRLEGLTDAQIKSELLGLGFDETTLDEAFAYTPAPTQLVDKFGDETGFSTDDEYVYCLDKTSGSQTLQILTGADPDTFEFLLAPDGGAAPLGKDKNSVYEMDANQCESVATAFAMSGNLDYTPDAATFNPIGGRSDQSFYAADKNHVFYWDGQFLDPVYGADPSTFLVNLSQSTYDAQDKNHEYLQGRVVK